MPPGNPHDPAVSREHLKTLAVRVLLGALLTLVIPGTALLASAVAPDEWLVFQTVLRVVALLSGLVGVGATLFALLDGVAEGKRLTSRLLSDDGPRRNGDSFGPHADEPAARRDRPTRAA